MILYVPTSGSTVAAALSAALWGLSRPPQVRRPNEVTTGLFGFITCRDGSVWLQVDTEFDIPIHQDAILDGIADIMQPWIDAQLIPADTNTLLENIINSHRGQRLIAWDAFPEFFKEKSQTREQLIDLGLLPKIGA